MLRVSHEQRGAFGVSPSPCVSLPPCLCPSDPLCALVSRTHTHATLPTFHFLGSGAARTPLCVLPNAGRRPFSDVPPHVLLKDQNTSWYIIYTCPEDVSSAEKLKTTSSKNSENCIEEAPFCPKRNKVGGENECLRGP